jgi:Universal stress protein UspA and related nucleotide-binding proteins
VYKKIMVPTDGSGFDREAIRVALRIAERSHAAVRLVRVNPTGTLFGMETSLEAASVSARVLRQERDRILGELDNLAAECRKISEARISTALEDGPVPDALRTYASRNNIDLIVISSHGRGGITRLSFGSVTDSLIRHTSIPVLVIKPHASYLNPGTGELFKRIIVPLDGSSLAEQILPDAMALAKMDEARLTLLTVLVPRTSSQDASAAQNAPWRDKDVAASQAYLYRTAAHLRENGCLTTTHVAIGENVGQVIADYASEVRADLVAIATHGRGGISRALRGSVADVVTRTGTTSMLVFRPIRVLTEELPAEMRRRPDGIPVIA